MSVSSLSAALYTRCCNTPRSQIGELNKRPGKNIADLGYLDRSELRRHVKACVQLSSDVERFMDAARVPGGDLRDSAEVLMYFRALPGVLRRYSGFAQRIGAMTDVVHELAFKKATYLVSLVEHVRSVIGELHLGELADLISGWRSIHPFTRIPTEQTLRKLDLRQVRRQGTLGLLTPKLRSTTAASHQDE